MILKPKLNIRQPWPKTAEIAVMKTYIRRIAGLTGGIVLALAGGAIAQTALPHASTSPTQTTEMLAVQQRFIDVTSPDAARAHDAIIALKRYGKPIVIPALIAGLRDGAAPRQEYLDALQAITGIQTPPSTWAEWMEWLQKRDGWPDNPAMDHLLVNKTSRLDQGYADLLPPRTALKIPTHDLVWNGEFLDQAGMFDHPQMSRANQARGISGSDIIIGMRAPDGTARAWPLKWLAGGTVINDQWQGQPITVYYSPLCGTAQVFGRHLINPESHAAPALRPTGFIHRGRPVLYERGSRGMWNACTGRAMTRDPAHQDLPIMTATTTSWGLWARENPATLVMTDTRSATRSEAMIGRMIDYAHNDRMIWPAAILDKSHHAKDHMIAVMDDQNHLIGLEALDLLGRRPVVNSRFSDHPIVLITPNPMIPTVYAFLRGDHFFEQTDFPDRVRDQDGHLWRVDENGLIDMNGGTSLKRLSTWSGYWFVFQDQLPDQQNHLTGLDLPSRPSEAITMPPAPEPVHVPPPRPLAATYPDDQSDYRDEMASIGVSRQMPREPVTFGKLRFPPPPRIARPIPLTMGQEAGIEPMPGDLPDVERQRLAKIRAEKQARTENIIRNPDAAIVNPADKPKRQDISGKEH